MVCSKCLSPIPDNTDRCPSCGNPVSAVMARITFPPKPKEKDPNTGKEQL